MTVTDQQARAIAFLAAAARPHGARRWDEAGILAAVKKVADRSLATVTIAAMQAAEDRKAETPGVIPTNGPHWRAPDPAAPVDPRPRYDPRKVCHICNQNEATCRDARDHPFQSVEAARAVRSVPAPAAVREAIADAPKSWPTRTLTEAAASAQAADTARARAARDTIEEDA